MTEYLSQRAYAHPIVDFFFFVGKNQAIEKAN
jgi:hypothetical protein